MNIDHFPGVLKVYSEEILGFVSPAEGFIFLSGYVAGLSYARTLAEKGGRAMLKRALGRARTIYFSHLCIFVIGFVALSVFRKSFAWPEWAWGWEASRCDHPFMTLFLGASLLYQPYQLCILPMYCFFILLVPPVVLMLRERRHWWILSISLGVWLLDQSWRIREHWAEWLGQFLPVDFGFFNIFCWQLLFVSGTVLGQCKLENRTNVIRLGWKTLAVLIGTAVVFFMFRHGLVCCAKTDLNSPLVEKFNLGPLRIVNFAIIAVLFSRPFLWPANSFWTRGLGYLGRHSLPVFSFQIILLYLFQCFILPHISVNNICLAIIAITSVGLLYFLAWICEMSKQPKFAIKTAVQ